MSETWRPDWDLHPGEILREKLHEMGVSGSEAADRMGVSPPFVSQLLAGRKGIGPVTALKLEALTGMSAEMWATLWVRYAVARERTSVRRSEPSGD